MHPEGAQRQHLGRAPARRVERNDSALPSFLVRRRDRREGRRRAMTAGGRDRGTCATALPVAAASVGAAADLAMSDERAEDGDLVSDLFELGA